MLRRIYWKQERGSERRIVLEVIFGPKERRMLLRGIFGPNMENLIGGCCRGEYVGPNREEVRGG